MTMAFAETVSNSSPNTELLAEPPQINVEGKVAVVAIIATLEELRDILRERTSTEDGWQERALCSVVEPELFFPEKSNVTTTRDAKKVCTMCDVREDCLVQALKDDERWGVWGGLSERERRKLKKRSAA